MLGMISTGFLIAATILLVSTQTTTTTTQAQMYIIGNNNTNQPPSNQIPEGPLSMIKNLTAFRNALLQKAIQQQQQFMNNGSDPNYDCKFHFNTNNLVYCPPKPFNDNNTKGGENK